MESKLIENKINLPIGTLISIKMKDKSENSIEVKLINSEETSKFIALFSENDVDFEIEIDNRGCDYGVGYTLTINEGYYDYYVGPRETWTMQALYSMGKKLHFLSQNTDEGQIIVAQTAAKHDISYSEAAAICCEIEFNFEVEKVAEKPIKAPIANLQESLSLSSKLMCSTLSTDSRSDSLYSKSLSYNKSSKRHLERLPTPIPAFCATPPPPRPQSSSLNVVSERLASLCEAESDLTLDFARSTLGGSSSRITDSSPMIQKLAKPIPNPIPFPIPQLIEDSPQENEERRDGGDNIGERGVICFGQQSDQIYNTFGGFVKDKNLIIKSFTIEMRMLAKK